MKRLWLVGLILFLLLAGCGAEVPGPVAPIPTQPATPEETTATEPTGYYDPCSRLEAAAPDAVRAYPLHRHDVMGFVPMDGDLLLFTGSEFTTLTRLTGNNLHTENTVHLDCSVMPDSPDVQVSEKGVTYYDEFKMEMVFLDKQLKEVRRISLPDTIIGRPALTADRKTIFYTTSDALRCIDLETNLDMLLKEMKYSAHSITALHCSDTIIECSVALEHNQWRNFYISTKTGQTLAQTQSEFQLDTWGEQYFGIHYDGSYRELLTGSGSQAPTILVYENLDVAVAPILELDAAILLTEVPDSTASTMDFYALQIGDRSYSLTLDAAIHPWSVYADKENQRIWALCYAPEYSCDTLISWYYPNCPVDDDNVYRRPRSTAQNPDTFGLEACGKTAAQMSEAYGVDIRIWEDATADEPWDYDLIPEYQVPLIQSRLEILGKALARFPAGFLETVASGEKIRICLVRSIEGSAENGTLDSAVGIQYWDSRNVPTIALSMDEKMEQSFYHELFHIIDSRVMSKCSLYDTWDTLNPKGFSYDYDYIANQSREDYQLTEGDRRAFIDIYSMSYPKEDRARIFEHAMLNYQEDTFASDIMQSKLSRLCAGIRKGFGFTKSTDIFPWEQYLKTA